MDDEPCQRKTYLKNCKSEAPGKLCSGIPGMCIVLQYVAVAILVGVLGYLFVTQELMAPEDTKYSSTTHENTR